MNAATVIRVVVWTALAALALAGPGLFTAPRVAGQESRPVVLRDAAALDQLKRDDRYDSLREAAQLARFGVKRAEATPLGRWAWHAPNPAAGYDGYVTEAGVSIAVDDRAYVSLSLHGLGYGAALQAVAPGEVGGDKQTISITRNNGLREWCVNGPEGLEHGFTLSAPPGARQPGAPLRMIMRVSEGWRAAAGVAGEAVTLRGPNDEAIEYGKLAAHDGPGRPLPARLTVADEQVVIEVDDSNAEYPLTIDPVFTLQKKLLAADGAVNDRLGWSVALSGDTAVLGAPYDDAPGADQGSAYVFVRTGATWTQQAKLTANDGAANDLFGFAVALQGDTALIGALYGPGPVSVDQGAVYVFTRTGATWRQQQRLNANDGASGELFGGAVALDGETAIVGARVHRVGTKPGQGAAYVFIRNGTIWALQKQLTANDGEDLDQFGAAVALDGDTALVGAPNDNIRNLVDQGSAYVFTRSGSTWTQQLRLTDTINADANDQFGNAVALSGDKILIGARLWGGGDHGTVLAFKRVAMGWEQINGIDAPILATNARFGVSVALRGDTAVVGASLGLFEPGADRRAAYVAFFDGDWNQVWQIGSAVGAENDRFGYAVALDGDTALVGACQSDAAAIDQGAAYAFALHDDQHIEQQKLTAGDGAESDFFGTAVAISGDTLAVGAPRDDVEMKKDQGSVYVFTRSGTAWTFQQKLTAIDGAINDQFGAAVAFSGDTLAVGAPNGDNGTAPDQGSVYVFTRQGTAWTLQKKIFANDGEPFDGFGEAVALDGNTLAVGASRDDIGTTTDQGSAYVFTRSGTDWTFQQKLTGLAGSPRDRFGNAVALSGDTLAVGAFEEEDDSRLEKGSAYVFARTGPTWRLQQHLIPSDGTAKQYFGSAVTLSGDALVVGAPETGAMSAPHQGAAYVYTRSLAAWTFQKKLTPGDGAAEAYFGTAVALSGSRLVVGAPGAALDAKSRPGAAYVFTGSGATWTQQQKLTASDGGANKLFGGSVAFDSDTAAIGAAYDVIGTTLNQGSAYVFVSPVCQDVTLSPSALPNAALNTAYHQQLAANGSGIGNDHYSLSGGFLPPGLSLNGAGLLAGTPTATDTYRFTISATNMESLCTGSRVFTLTVTPPCPALTLAPATLPSGKRSVAFSQTLATMGGAAPYNYAVTTGALPPGISLRPGGVLSGTPTAAETFDFVITSTDANGCTATRAYTLTIHPNTVNVVSAASYLAGVAPESIAVAFGVDLAGQTIAAAELPLPTELAGVRVLIRDSQGMERAAPLFFVSPGQINFQVPPFTAPGTATIRVTGQNSGATGQFEVTRTAPGLFSANADGQGAANAMALRVRANGTQSFEPVARFDGVRFVPAPIDLGPIGEQVYLVAYGTGFRFQQRIAAHFGGEFTNVLFAGAVSGLVGLDQVNVLIPRSLIGAGEVSLRLRVDDVYANSVRIHVR